MSDQEQSSPIITPQNEEIFLEKHSRVIVFL